eukprot:JP438642.1.p1 GENE.JP438642.1~~JP438642.1.p1  ORF type:complete len:128 (+),score=1.62 JP438642.1:1-384(+)
MGNPSNWYRGYHGTSIDVAKPIYEDGFKPSSWGKLGPGVYVSPHLEYALNYARSYKAKIQTQKGLKEFFIIIQVGVRPGSIEDEGYGGSWTTEKLQKRYGKEPSEWVIPEPADVRPYGVLIKDAALC